MGLEKVARCDVFGGLKDVRLTRVVVSLRNSDGTEIEGAVTEFPDKWLSNKARTRLIRKIEQGLAPPTRKGKKMVDKPGVQA